METPNEEDGPISFSLFNIKRIPPKIQQTCFGKIRAFNSFTALEWVYLIIALIALTVSFGITIERMTIIDSTKSDFTFAILILLTIVFCYLYVIHSIFTERWDELMVFVTCNLIVLIYCIVNYVTGVRNLLKLARLIFISVCSPFLIGVGALQCLKYFHSNNLIFNTVGPILSLQKSCQVYYICSSLLKFDLQLQLSMLILAIGTEEGTTIEEPEHKIILASGVPITFLFIIVGFLGLRHENIRLMILFYTLSLLEPCYITYKFIYIAMNKAHIDAIYNSTFVCGSFAIVIWLLLIFCTLYFMVYHFGKGLKEKMFDDDKSTEPGIRPDTPLLNPVMTGIQSIYGE